MEIHSSGNKSTGMLVNEDGRALVEAVSILALVEASRKGKAFVTASGFVPISTTGTDHGILYIKNTSDDILFIDRIRTCGDQIQKWKFYKNPTAGTLITAASNATIENLNFESGLTPDSINYKGVNGSTITDGVAFAQHVNNIGHSQEIYEGAIELGKSDSIAIVVNLAQAGDACVTVIYHFAPRSTT